MTKEILTIEQVKKELYKNKQKFNIEFEGFYHSTHSDNIDYFIDEYYNLNFDNVDYKNTFIEYSKKYINILNDILEIDLKFIQLNSPRFYNYETDKIEVEINDNDFNKLNNIYLNDNDFINYVNESCKSYDGYISFYKDIEHVKESKEILLVYIFNYIIHKEYNQEINESIMTDLEIEIITNK